MSQRNQKNAAFVHLRSASSAARTRYLSRADTIRIKDETFYRPIGGRIEFGERGAETVAREIREEINAEVANLVYLGALENIFTYESKSAS